MTFGEFCAKHTVSKRERYELACYLAMMRSKKLIERLAGVPWK